MTTRGHVTQRYNRRLSRDSSPDPIAPSKLWWCNLLVVSESWDVHMGIILLEGHPSRRSKGQYLTLPPRMIPQGIIFKSSQNSKFFRRWSAQFSTLVFPELRRMYTGPSTISSSHAPSPRKRWQCSSVSEFRSKYFVVYGNLYHVRVRSGYPSTAQRSVFRSNDSFLPVLCFVTYLVLS